MTEFEKASGNKDMPMFLVRTKVEHHSISDSWAFHGKYD
jgi:hypothetical protein